jgi:hypothetical protein
MIAVLWMREAQVSMSIELATSMPVYQQTYFLIVQRNCVFVQKKATLPCTA